LSGTWQELALGDVVKLEYGKPLDGSCRIETGAYPVYGANGPMSRSNKFYYDKPSIIVGRKGSAGEVNLTEPKFWPLDVTYFVTFDDTRFDLRFLFHLLKSLDLPQFARGVKPGINRNDVYSVRARFPPRAEQRRIVGILDEAFDAIAVAKANTFTNLANLSSLHAALVDAAIQGELHTHSGESVDSLLSRIDEIRYVASNKAGASPSIASQKSNPVGRPTLPVGWAWEPLARLTTRISDGVHKKPHYVKAGVPFVMVKNLTAGPGISFEEVRYISRSDHEEFIKRTRPEKGDILVTKDGTIGVVRLIETDTEFSIFVSLALIKPVLRELGSYLRHALQASCVKSQIIPQGAALKHLYLVDLRKMMVPLPPLTDQKRIVAVLDVLSERVRHLELIYLRKIEALEKLKSSLLTQAFSGAI